MNSNVQEGVSRIILGLVTVWISAWAYVGWRAYGLREGAASYVASLPPGSDVPAEVSAVIDASTEWLRISLILGVLPVFLLAGVWLYRSRK